MSEEEFIKMIGANIAKRRKEKGLSQADLALMSGITEEKLILIETGKFDAPILTINHIAVELDITVRDLLD